MARWILGIFSEVLRPVIAGMALFIGMLAAMISANAAVVPELSVRQDPPFALSFAYGAAVDPLGNIYVADTYNNRVIKYDPQGRPRRAWGSFGSELGQFYYPLGVAVGINPSTGGTRIYVADTFNHRIAVYDSQGRFQFVFGGLGSGDGQLDHPEGIAVLPHTASGTRDVCVADSRNARISCFSEQGTWKRSFYCSQCPGQRFFKPVGLAIRALTSGSYRLYVADNYPGQIHVIDGKGRWIRSFGGPGQSGELAFPDDIAVDPDDGAVFVTDTGFGVEQVSRFNPDGTFDYAFKSDGLNGFVSPHGLTMDGQGALYVVSSGTPSVTKFKIEAPALTAGLLPTASRQYWAETRGAWFDIAYNGVEQTCVGGASATITAPGRSWTIRTSASEIPVKWSFTPIKMDLTVAQISKIKDVWKSGGSVNVVTVFRARCADGTRLIANPTFTK